MVWTTFMDMHSGGSRKLDWEHIYIEAPEAEAEVIFYNRFGRNPHRVTCTCCGEDYSVREAETLAQATAFERGCKYDHTTRAYAERPSAGLYQFYTPLDAYLSKPSVHVISAADIKPEERVGSLPRQGYIWVGED